MGCSRWPPGLCKTSSIALAHCEAPDLAGEARELEEKAARMFHTLGNPRMDGAARTYLALILDHTGDHVTAETAARRAVDVLAAVPPTRALALAVLARALLAQHRAEDALAPAIEAMHLLTSLGGIDDGEALVRLAYAQALHANGRVEEAREAATSARERLLERAAKIDRPEWRQSFLENVPENAETLARAFS